MMRVPSYLVCLVIAVAQLATPIEACAQPTPEQVAEGRVHFDRGVILFDQSNHDGALVEFQRAWELSQRPSVLFNIAATCQALHRYGDAIEALRRFVELSPAADRQRRQAERTIRELQELIAYVQVSPTPADANVTLDGREQRANTDILVGPGTHRFEVVRAGRHSATGQFSVASGERRVVRVTLTDSSSAAQPIIAVVDPALERSAPDPPTPIVTPPPVRLSTTPAPIVAPSQGLHPRWFWITAAGTGALLLSTVIVGASALSTHSDYMSLPAGSYQLAELESRGRALSLAADVLGITTIGAGAVLVWLATRTDFRRPGTPAPSTTAPRVLLLPSEGGATLTSWVRF